MIVSEKFRLCGQRNMTRIAEQLNVNVSTISRDWAWLDEHYKQVAAENVQIALGEWRKTHDILLNTWMAVMLDSNVELVERARAAVIVQRSLDSIAKVQGFGSDRAPKEQGLDLMRTLARLTIEAEKKEAAETAALEDNDKLN